MSTNLPIKIDVSTDKEEYRRMEPIKIRVVLTNLSSDKIILTFRSAKMFDIFLLDSSKKIIATWSKGKFFAQVITNLTLGPKENLEKYVIWNVFKDALVMPGVYYLEVYLEAIQGKASSNLVKVTIK
ncbi:MAG: BsuPI-related putative proteinase inhibitor [Candidatus Asgardarchaeia archaeon]